MHDLGDAYVANRGAAAMKDMWPHRSLIDAGVPAPGHSDAAVCQPSPWVALWAMINRRSGTGADLDRSQAVTPLEALKAYTTLAAWSGFGEGAKGSLFSSGAGGQGLNQRSRGEKSIALIAISKPAGRARKSKLSDSPRAARYCAGAARQARSGRRGRRRAGR